jgi:hypothetical protein
MAKSPTSASVSTVACTQSDTQHGIRLGRKSRLIAADMCCASTAGSTQQMPLMLALGSVEDVTHVLLAIMRLTRVSCFLDVEV